jgi:CheY-like chemotaxis protein
MIGRMALSVLVVDDDPAFLGLATRIIREMGFEEVATSSDATAAMAQAQATHPAAVLVDVGLPDVDGVELAQQLAALPWSPIVVLTSADRDALTAAPPSGRALPFIPKEELASGRLYGLLHES